MSKLGSNNIIFGYTAKQKGDTKLASSYFFRKKNGSNGVSNKTNLGNGRNEPKELESKPVKPIDEKIRRRRHCRKEHPV